MVILLKTKMTKLLMGVLVLAIVATPVMANFIMVNNAQGISYYCQQSAACREAAAKEQAANQAALSATSSANMYQNKVNELSAEIASKEREIAESEAEVAGLKQEIEETEKELLEKQTALADLLIEKHFEGDTEPITILAGSESISDLAERQARNETVEQQIGAMSEKIKEAKAQLEADKARVENLLAEQKTARADLVAKRSEQQELVAKYQSNAAAYNQMAEEARLARIKAEEEEQKKYAGNYTGGIYTGTNTYPWQASCPQDNIKYTTYWGGYKIGGYVCQCVSYAGWKAYEAYGIPIAWGNAYSWDDAARRAGYTVNNTPAAGTIGQDNSGTWGHVFWVESVNADGSINVTEYNNRYATQLYSGIYRAGDFGARKISAAQAKKYNYIHLR